MITSWVPPLEELRARYGVPNCDQGVRDCWRQVGPANERRFLALEAAGGDVQRAWDLLMTVPDGTGVFAPTAPPPEPPPPPQLGACCRSDGSCSQTVRTACLGVFWLAGSPCSACSGPPQPPPEPPPPPTVLNLDASVLLPDGSGALVYEITIGGVTLRFLRPAHPGENDGAVCELPGQGHCRALEHAIAGPGVGPGAQPGVAGSVLKPSGYEEGVYRWMVGHAFFYGSWKPTQLPCGRAEVLALWRQPLTSSPRDSWELVGSIAPCAAEIGRAGTDEHGGGSGTIFRAGGLHYSWNQTFVCDSWGLGCFPGIYVGAATSLAGPYQWSRSKVLSRWTLDGAEYGWNQPYLREWSDPAPPWPRQSLRGHPATVWGVVSWGPLAGAPAQVAQIQCVDLPDGVVRPRWSTFRCWVEDEAGTWRLVPTNGQPDFLPRSLQGLRIGTLHHDETRWGLVYQDRVFTAPGVGGCDETRRSAEPGMVEPILERPAAPEAEGGTTLRGGLPDAGNSVVVFAPLDGSPPTVYDADTYTINGRGSVGAMIWRHQSESYAVYGSTERFCFSSAPDSAWWHPWVHGELVVERIAP